MGNKLTGDALNYELMRTLALLWPENLQELRKMVKPDLTQPDIFDEFIDAYQRLTQEEKDRLTAYFKARI